MLYLLVRSESVSTIRSSFSPCNGYDREKWHLPRQVKRCNLIISSAHRNPSSDIQPSIDLNKCAHDNFEFGFRYGLQIDNFVLDLKQVHASQTAYQVINSSARNSNWICVKNPEEGIKERCHYNGVLNISP